MRIPQFLKKMLGQMTVTMPLSVDSLVLLLTVVLVFNCLKSAWTLLRDSLALNH